MGRMKELFTEYQQQMTGSNADLIDDEYHFQKWVEDREIDWTDTMEEQYWKAQCPEPFATPEDLEQMYSASVLPNELFYDDEYYKSTYQPTREEEETAFKLFNKE